MGLIARSKRLHYIWSWRLRYWWLDTESGAQTRVALYCLVVVATILYLIRTAVAALAPRPAGEPQQAVIWWVVILIIAIVLAAISYAMRPKPQQNKPPEHQSPTVEDGLAVKDYFGTCWIGDEFMLAWKVTGRTPIYAKGGKK